HVPSGGRGCLVGRVPTLPGVHVCRVPVPPVVRWGDRLEGAVMVGGLVQKLGQSGDVHGHVRLASGSVRAAKTALVVAPYTRLADRSLPRVTAAYSYI